MKRFFGSGLGIAGGGLGIIIGLLLFLGRAMFEMEVETLLLGYLSSSTIGIIAIILSVIMILGALMARRNTSISAALLIIGGIVGFLLLGIIFVIPMILALISAAFTLFMRESSTGDSTGY